MLCTPLCTSDLVLVIALVARSRQALGLSGRRRNPELDSAPGNTQAPVGPAHLTIRPHRHVPKTYRWAPFMIIASVALRGAKRLKFPASAGTPVSGRLEHSKGKLRELLPRLGLLAERPPDSTNGRKRFSKTRANREARTAKVTRQPQAFPSRRSKAGGRILGISSGSQQPRRPLRRWVARGQRFSEYRGRASNRLSVQQAVSAPPVDLPPDWG